MLPVFVSADSAHASHSGLSGLSSVAITVPKPTGVRPGDVVIAIVIADVDATSPNNNGDFVSLGFPQDDAGQAGWHYNGFSSFGSTQVHSKLVTAADMARTGWEFTYLVVEGPLVELTAAVLAYRRLGILTGTMDPLLDGGAAMTFVAEAMYPGSYYTHTNPLRSPRASFLPDAAGNCMALTVWACFTQRQNVHPEVTYPPVPATFTPPVGPLTEFDDSNPQTITQAERVDAGGPMGLMVAETIFNRVALGYSFPLLGPLESSASVLSPPDAHRGGFATVIRVMPQGGCVPYLPAAAHTFDTRVVQDKGTRTIRGRAAQAPRFAASEPRALCAPSEPATARDQRVRVRARPRP